MTDCDPTRHAELSLVSDVCRRKIKVANSTLYTSCEPCMMCCGAIYWCGVRRIVFSCSHSSLAKHAGDALLVSSTSLLGPASASGVTIVGPILEELGEEPQDILELASAHLTHLTQYSTVQCSTLLATEQLATKLCDRE